MQVKEYNIFLIYSHFREKDIEPSKSNFYKLILFLLKNQFNKKNISNLFQQFDNYLMKENYQKLLEEIRNLTKGNKNLE